MCLLWLALPECSADTQLTDGQEANFTCFSIYSGNQPRLKWFRGDTAIESRDDSETRIAKQVVHWNTSYKDDKQRFTCKMILDEFTEECSFYLDVTCELNSAALKNLCLLRSYCIL